MDRKRKGGAGVKGGRGGWALIPEQNPRRSCGWIFYTFSRRKPERDTRMVMAVFAPACRAAACPCMAPGPGGKEEEEEALMRQSFTFQDFVLYAFVSHMQ